MAFTAGSNYTVQNKVSSTSIAFSSTSYAVGLAVLVVACDAQINTGQSGFSTTSLITASDNIDGSWTKAGEYTGTPGFAGYGVTVALFYATITSTTSRTVTASFSTSVTAKAASIQMFSFSGGSSLVFLTPVTTGTSNQNLGSLSITIPAGRATNEALSFRASGIDNTGGTTATSGYTGLNNFTSGGTNTDNIGAFLEYIISTTTPAASNPLGPATGWSASVMGAVYEVPIVTERLGLLGVG